MEAADVLYGVTMGPDGGSHVVSARMAEREIDADETSASTPAKAATSRRHRPGRGPAAVAMVDLENASGPDEETDEPGGAASYVAASDGPVHIETDEIAADAAQDEVT
jgi:hypothetical protein